MKLGIRDWGFGVRAKEALIILISFSIVLLLGAGCQQQPTGDAFPYPQVGSTAEFQKYPRWDVHGRVTVIDDRTLRLDNFSFNGGEVKTEIRLQNNAHFVATLLDITGKIYDRDSLELTLPDTVTLSDFNLVTIYSPHLGSPLSGASFNR